MKPAAWSVGQNRLPGRAKWCPTSALRRDGLIPTKRTRSPGPTRGASSGVYLPAKYWALIGPYFVHSSGSWSSAKHASTGHASTHASQSMHSSGSM